MSFGLWAGAGLWRFIGSGAGVPGYRGCRLGQALQIIRAHSWLMIYFWYEEIIICSYSAWGVLGWGV